MNNCYRGYILIAFWVCSLVVYGQTEMQAIDTLRNIRLQEVIVTATQSDAPGTRSVIGQDAIRHIQATDLSVLSQLLPGVLVRNPELNAPAAFTIRSATSENTTNALGTAIEVDGLRMNNNANMQQMGLEGRGSLFNSTVLSGFDVRSLSPSSVESVEVIRGVPSARYGDVTSGVVGVTPEYQFAFGVGAPALKVLCVQCEAAFLVLLQGRVEYAPVRVLGGMEKVAVGGGVDENLLVGGSQTLHQLVNGGNDAGGEAQLFLGYFPAVVLQTPVPERLVIPIIVHTGIAEDAAIDSLAHGVQNLRGHAELHICHPHADKFLVLVGKDFLGAGMEDVLPEAVGVQGVGSTAVNDFVKVIHRKPPANSLGSMLV